MEDTLLNIYNVRINTPSILTKPFSSNFIEYPLL